MAHQCWRQGAVMVSLRSACVVIDIILGGIVLAGSVFWSWTFFSPAYLPPTKYVSMSILNSPISEIDDYMVGQAVIDRRRNCPGYVNRTILLFVGNEGAEEIIHRDIVQIPTTNVGDGVIVVFKMQLPRPRIPGNYIYRGIVRFDCD